MPSFSVNLHVFEINFNTFLHVFEINFRSNPHVFEIIDKKRRKHRDLCSISKYLIKKTISGRRFLQIQLQSFCITAVYLLLDRIDKQIKYFFVNLQKDLLYPSNKQKNHYFCLQ